MVENTSLFLHSIISEPWAMFVLGAIVGSFLNVVALRWGTKEGIFGRSHCTKCNETLRPYELIPLVSFLLQRGSCRHCGATISWVYFFGELATAVLFALVSLQGFGIAVTLLLWIFIALLMVISLYDVGHMIIPDALTTLFAIVILVGFSLSVHSPVFDGFIVVPEIMSLWKVLLVPLPFFLLWLYSDGLWIGLGDVKLMVPMALYLGPIEGILAVIFGFWIGSIAILVSIPVVTILHRILKKPSMSWRNIRIPFGPFLALGFLVVAIFGITMAQVLEVLYV